jgi:hypothetical protein
VRDFFVFLRNFFILSQYRWSPSLFRASVKIFAVECRKICIIQIFCLPL